jgi:hypothetical protein
VAKVVVQDVEFDKDTQGHQRTTTLGSPQGDMIQGNLVIQCVLGYLYTAHIFKTSVVTILYASKSTPFLSHYQ